MDIVVFIGLSVTLLGLATPVLILHQSRFSRTAQVRRRVQALAAGGRDAGEGGDAATRTRQKLIQSKLQEMEKQRAQRRDTLSQLLKQAGLTMTTPTYAGYCAATSASIGLLMMIFQMSPMACIAGAAAGATAIPRFIVKRMVAKRQAKFTEHFSSALDILVRGARTGLPVGECLRIVGREVPEPVGFEFRMLVESQRIGMTTEQALQRGLERMPTSDFQFFAVVLVIQQQTGGNLAATLENLSNVLRSRKRLKDKIQAMSSEAKASAMIIGSLPFFVGSMIYLINPTYIGLLFTTRTGSMILTGGALWMAAGILVMHQMINFKV